MQLKANKARAWEGCEKGSLYVQETRPAASESGGKGMSSSAQWSRPD